MGTQAQFATWAGSAVEVKGDSVMLHLNDGDAVLVEHTRIDLKVGMVVASRVGGELFVKRLQKMDTS